MDKYVIEVTASEAVTIAADFQKMQDIYGDEGRTNYWEADDIARNIAQWFGERITSAIQNQEGIRKVQVADLIDSETHEEKFALKEFLKIGTVQT